MLTMLSGYIERHEDEIEEMIVENTEKRLKKKIQ